MSMKYLGPQIDIHTGGVDHIRVHHTNEIAQSEAATGKKPFAKYWVHHNFLTVDGEKMSKSKENFYTIDDVMEKDFEPMALRLLFLGAHYRSELNFTWESLQAAQNSWDKLKEVVAQLLQEAQGEEASFSRLFQDYRNQFFTAMANDLSTPEALAVFWQVVKNKELPAAEKLALLLDFDQLLGLDLGSIQAVDKKQPLALGELPDEVKAFLKEREKARQQGDYAKSDQLRDQLFDLGFQVIDDEDGQMVFDA
jgi:cysteinyl-tRNA synthetase